MAGKQQDTRSTTPRVKIIQTVETPLGFFTLTVLVVEAILGVTAGFSQGADRTWLIIGMLALIFVLAIIVALIAVFRPEALSGKRPPASEGIVRELENRDLYITEMIKNVDSAQTAVWLSIHTLSPSSTSHDIATLQGMLAKAKAEGKDVRVLAPVGVERMEAAYELQIQRKVPIKALTFLDVEDLRYMIIDHNISIISLGVSGTQGSSTAGAIIESEQLNRLLREHFEKRWSQQAAMDYEDFLSFEVHKLLNPSQPPSRKAIADTLHIPVPEIERALRIQPAKMIFLLGRPGSGKTSAIHAITDCLLSAGYDKSQVSVYNDYRLLATWSQQDKLQQRFEPGPRGGFRVKDFGVLDECLQEINRLCIAELNSKQFIIVEFSRNNYVSALQNFRDDLLRFCTIFYLHTPMSVCAKRNEERTVEGAIGESGYVPPDILETYYKEDDIEHLGEIYAGRLMRVDNGEAGIGHLREKIVEQVNKRLTSWLLESKRQQVAS